MNETAPRYLTATDGTRIAYHHTPAADKGAGLPGVVFLGGFKSDMNGTKAMRLEAFCRERGQQFTRLDYRGHGQSGGRFEDGTIGLWRDDALAVIDSATSGPRILVGSSMGGWMMLLAAQARPDRAVGLIGIAAAPDFVVRMAEDLTREQKAALVRDGFVTRPTSYAEEPYIITRRLIEEGGDHLVLDRPIPFTGPVRLLHGMLDDAVPWKLSLTIAENIASADVRVTFVKSGDHRLSSASDLDLLCATVEEVSRGLQA